MAELAQPFDDGVDEMVIASGKSGEKGGVFVSLKPTDSTERSSENVTDSEQGGAAPAYAYEVENMAHDKSGHIVVETSELGITVLKVDDDPTLNPWTFRTFFLGRPTYISFQIPD